MTLDEYDKLPNHHSSPPIEGEIYMPNKLKMLNEKDLLINKVAYIKIQKVSLVDNHLADKLIYKEVTTNESKIINININRPNSLQLSNIKI